MLRSGCWAFRRPGKRVCRLEEREQFRCERGVFGGIRLGEEPSSESGAASFLWGETECIYSSEDLKFLSRLQTVG